MSSSNLLGEIVRKSSLKVVFVTHFVMVALILVCADVINRMLAFTFYNLVLLLLVAWAIHAESSIDAVLLALIVDAVSVIFDILVISLGVVYGTFATFLFIFHLLSRLFTMLLLVKNYSYRSGTVDPTAGILEFEQPPAQSSSGSRATYLDIDRNSQQGATP